MGFLLIAKFYNKNHSKMIKVAIGIMPAEIFAGFIRKKSDLRR
jgi:hypothetical protein